MTARLMVIAASLGVASGPVSLVYERAGHAMCAVACVLGAVFVWAAIQETKLRAFLARTVIDPDAAYRAAYAAVGEELRSTVRPKQSALPGDSATPRGPLAQREGAHTTPGRRIAREGAAGPFSSGGRP